MAEIVTYDSTCPIFTWGGAGTIPEQVGSGVLLKLGEEVFLLTAAHVTDLREKGRLLIPGKDGLADLVGHIAYIPVPKSLGREEDKIDVAYYRLLPELRRALHPALRVLTRDDVMLCDMLEPDDHYTFAGYPWRRSKVVHTTAQTELCTYTGHACSQSVYSKLGYDPSVHILIRFRRKKSFHVHSSRMQTAPHPSGISGGGVFAWPKDISENPRFSQPKLVGIGHTYHEAEHCLVGTRLNVYLAGILRNNPNLNPPTKLLESGPTPLYLGMVWYQKEEWDKLRADFTDADRMHKTWAEWREAALNHLEQAWALGMQVYPMVVGAQEIAAYCREHACSNNSHARTDLANRKFAALIFSQSSPET